jgi:hypothetical protein
MAMAMCMQVEQQMFISLQVAALSGRRLSSHVIVIAGSGKRQGAS